MYYFYDKFVAKLYIYSKITLITSINLGLLIIIHAIIIHYSDGIINVIDFILINRCSRY